MAEIVNIFIDNEPLTPDSNVIKNTETVLIPSSLLEKGDKVSVVTDSANETNQEAILLSVNHPNKYKNLTVEVEFEFVKQINEYRQQLEIIVRAVNNQDKSFTVDEYYAFGVIDESFYLAKVGLHKDSTNSFAYKSLLNINTETDGIITHLKMLTSDQIAKLFLPNNKLKYNNKYKFLCSIVDNLATLKIKNTSLVESFETSYEWLTIFENVNIEQLDNQISKRSSDLQTILSTSEQTTVINGTGLFGLVVPSSHVKLFRYEVKPLDKNINIELYDAEQYSRNVCTDFSVTYRNNTVLKLNSSDSTVDTVKSYKEFLNHTGNYIELDTLVAKNDIDYLQFNNITVTNGKHYEDKFIDIAAPMTVDHNGSAIKAFVDSDNTNTFGQREQYITLEDKTDGVSYEFNVSDEVFEKLLYPNSFVINVLLEADKDIVYNNFYEVGIQENPDRFISYDELQEQYNGRKFFMETEYRRENKIFEMGPLGNGRFTFKIDEYFTNGNTSYNALWKYNLANFFNFIFDKYSGDLTIQPGISATPLEGFSLETQLVSAVPGDLWGTKEFGIMLADVNPEHIKLLAENTDIDLNFRNNSPDAVLKKLIREGLSAQYIRNISGLFKNLEAPYFKELILSLIDKSLDYNTTLQTIFATYGQPSEVDPVSVLYLALTEKEYVDAYYNFRTNWIKDLDYNSHITTNGMENRNFYISIDSKSASINKATKTIVFNVTPKANKKIILRMVYDCSVEITKNYLNTDKYYRVSDAIKQLYVDSNREKGVVELLEYFHTSKYSTTIHNDVVFAVIPKKFNENNSNLYADIQLCHPNVEKTENVKRYVRAPLRKVSELLATDFESSVYGEVFPYTTTDLANLSSNGVWYRESDLFDTNIEFMNVDGYPKCYPIPPEGDYYTYFSAPISGQPLSGSGFIIGLISGGPNYVGVVEDTIVDQYLNVARWYDVGNSKLGPYYKRVLSSIIDIKTENRYQTDKKIIAEGTDDPMNVGNWFDGFYTGKKTPWNIVVSGGNDFSIYSGNPWGTQNSRKRMIEQIKETLDNKYENYDIYFADLQTFIDYETYTLEGGYEQSYMAKPVGYDDAAVLLNVPYVDSKMSEYIFNENVTVTNVVSLSATELLFSKDNFVFATEDIVEYPAETKEAYGNLDKMAINVIGVVRPINNGIDMYWNFNSSILFPSLPDKTTVNAEYEYTMPASIKYKNYPERVIQKVNLGISDGSENQTFSNPDVMFSKNVSYANVHKVWLDNYKTTDFVINNVSGKERIVYSLPYSGTMDVAVKYKESNYQDIKKANLFIDDFKNNRQLFWYFLTRNDKGYVKTVNSYQGMVVDETVLNENVFKLYDFYTVDGEYNIKTGGTSKAVSNVNVYQIGQDSEQIVSLISLQRNNNFELSCDVYYNENIPRDLMQTDFIFRGSFKDIDGKQYLNEFYSLSINAETSMLSLIARQIGDNGQYIDQVLVSLDNSAIQIKKNTFYTVKIKVIKETFSVYFNERHQEEIFYFSYNLKNGYAESDTEYVAKSIMNGLGLQYQNPNFVIEGNNIGLKVRSDMVYFANFSIKMLEENNFKLGNTFEINSYDAVISSLQKHYKITDPFKKIRRTSNGYEYLQIGNNLFAKQAGGSYMKHAFYVEDFEVIDDYVYVQEKVAAEVNFVVINVYKEIMRLEESIVVEGKTFINEPIFSYLADYQRVISKIEKVNGKLFITTMTIVLEAATWNDFNDAVWNEVSLVWNVYG